MNPSTRAPGTGTLVSGATNATKLGWQPVGLVQLKQSLSVVEHKSNPCRGMVRLGQPLSEGAPSATFVRREPNPTLDMGGATSVTLVGFLSLELTLPELCA